MKKFAHLSGPSCDKVLAWAEANEHRHPIAILYLSLCGVCADAIDAREALDPAAKWEVHKEIFAIEDSAFKLRDTVGRMILVRVFAHARKLERAEGKPNEAKPS